MTPTRIFLVIIVIAAFVLRVIGIQYGLPSVYNPDEVAIMARALSFAKGTLNPHNFLYPTLYFYVLFGWVGAYLGFVWLTGGVSSIAALPQLYFTDPTGIYTAGRLLGAVCGTLSVVAAYRLARRLFDAEVGLAAAVFLAFAPLAVRDAHYVKHDVPATLAVLVAMIAMTRVWPGAPDRDDRHAVLVAGAATGVAFSTHYYCIFLALPLTWVIVQRWRASGWRAVVTHLVTAAVASAVLFFALSPFILVEPVTAWRDITANRAIVIDRAVESGAFAPLRRYLEILWTDSVGHAVLVLAVLGAGFMVARARQRAVLLLLFPLAFLAFIANTAPASRYLNPVLPFLAILAAWMLAFIATRFRVGGTAFMVMVGLCAGAPLAASLRTGQFFRQDDTRAIAERFIEAQIPAGSTIAVQPYSVVLTPSRDALRDALQHHLGSAEAASTKFRLQLSLDPYPEPSYRLIYLGRGGLDVDRLYVDPAELYGSNLAPLRRLGVSYVVLKRYNDADPETNALAAELGRHGRLIAAFSPYRDGTSDADRRAIAPFLHNTDTRIADALARPGPPLEIWQLNGPDS